MYQEPVFLCDVIGIPKKLYLLSFLNMRIGLEYKLLLPFISTPIFSPKLAHQISFSLILGICACICRSLLSQVHLRRRRNLRMYSFEVYFKNCFIILSVHLLIFFIPTPFHPSKSWASIYYFLHFYIPSITLYANYHQSSKYTLLMQG